MPDSKVVHTCWDDPAFDGQMQEGCPGCDLAAQHKCRWCGYGHVFTTHNPLAHAENGDPIILAIGEDSWVQQFDDGGPYTEGNAA